MESEAGSHRSLTAWELRVLRTVAECGNDDAQEYGYRHPLRMQGWVETGRVHSALKTGSLATKRTLRRLSGWGYLDQVFQEGVEFFHINSKGEAVISSPLNSSLAPESKEEIDEIISIDEIERILKLIFEFEKNLDSIENNYERSQAIGLIRSIEILLEMPDPPKTGIIAILRDPVFANFIQVGILAAAIVAILR